MNEVGKQQVVTMITKFSIGKEVEFRYISFSAASKVLGSTVVCYSFSI